MTSKIKEIWKKSANLRASLPNILRPDNIFSEDTGESDINKDKSFFERINNNLLEYKEIKLIYKKTGIPPAYFAIILAICILFIFIGYFDNYLTHLIATVYPMYISYKTLQNESATQDDITQWLTYW